MKLPESNKFGISGGRSRNQGGVRSPDGPPIEDASGALAWRIKELELEEEVVATVYPDSRGEGYGMRRFDDSPVLDFSLLADEPEVHFTHARGFIMKTSARKSSDSRNCFSWPGPIP